MKGARQEMSKSILVIDTPELCVDCPLFKHDLNCIPEDYCNVLGKEIVVLNKKPDWCPLRDLPRKKGLFSIDGTRDVMMIYARGLHEGFNACIDKILKGTDKK